VTAAEFVKHYDNPAAAAAARRHYCWLAAHAKPLRQPVLRSVAGARVGFEYISGRHAETRDLPRLAALLGDAHGAAWESDLRNAHLDTPHALRDGGSLGDFQTSRRAALDRRLEQGYLPSIAALRAMLTLLEKPAGEPAAFYKDSNPRTFLLTGNGTIFTIDTDDLTLAPFGYDLAKLVATLTMTYGEIHPACIERALQIYNRAAAQHDARLGTTTLERLEEFLALHEVLNAPYAGRNGYRYLPPPHPAPRNQRTRPAPRRARRPDRGIMTARIAIIGMGHVGKAMHSLLCQQAEIVTYDAAWAVDYPARELAACDAGIICVDTPTGDGGACDATHVRDAVERLPAGAVLIKSTIPPGTTDLLASTTGKQVCFSPEYVGESTHHPFWPGGDRDVPFMILGGGPPARRQFIDLLQPVLGPARTYFQCAAIEAEIIEYMENAYLATKVTFVSEFRRICEAFGADWHTVREGLAARPPDRAHPHCRVRQRTRIQRQMPAQRPRRYHPSCHRRWIPSPLPHRSALQQPAIPEPGSLRD
jgi:hypothetical protein